MECTVGMLIADVANKIIVKYFIWYFLNVMLAFSELKIKKIIKKSQVSLIKKIKIIYIFQFQFNSN